jgi:hypothetical protein
MASTPTELDRIGTIGLEELNTRAALLVRVDRKYLVDDASVARLLDDLPEGTCGLEIDGNHHDR